MTMWSSPWTPLCWWRVSGRCCVGRRTRYPGPERATGDGPPPSEGDLLVFGDLSIDTGGMEVFVSGSPVALTPTELKLLLEFAAHPGIVLERHTLLRDVWEYGWDGDSRVVDLCVQRLRRKLGRDRIETVRGFGYKLRR